MASGLDDPGAAAEAFLDRIGKQLRNKKQRASFATYALGLMSGAERKSVEPIAALGCAGPERMDAEHQRLLHFLAEAEWDDRAVRLEAAQHALERIEEHEVIEAWIVDDTGFLKQGRHSVGVQRQYTGSAGKVANCQVGVSLTLASRSHHVGVDFELYLPESWANEPERRKEARIPPEVGFRTKPELARGMIERALSAKLPRGLVLADAAYGDASEFRETLRAWGLDYGVGVSRTLRLFEVDERGRLSKKVTTAAELASKRSFRRVTWRQGTAGPLSARFAFAAVVPARDDGWKPEEREVVHLVCEWRDGEDEPRFHLTSLPADRLAHSYVVRMLKQRWRTERLYEDLKTELGLDHYEGRRFGGWHHHVSVVLACHAFVTAERAAFPPSDGDDEDEDAENEHDSGPLDLRNVRATAFRQLAAARALRLPDAAPRAELHPHAAAPVRSRRSAVAPSLPRVPSSPKRPRSALHRKRVTQ